MEEKPGRENHGRGTMEEASWERDHGWRIIGKESWERNHGKGFMRSNLAAHGNQ